MRRKMKENKKTTRKKDEEQEESDADSRLLAQPYRGFLLSHTQKLREEKCMRQEVRKSKKKK